MSLSSRAPSLAEAVFCRPEAAEEPYISPVRSKPKKERKKKKEKRKKDKKPSRKRRSQEVGVIDDMMMMMMTMRTTILSGRVDLSVLQEDDQDSLLQLGSPISRYLKWNELLV